MADLFWFTVEQVERMSPHFPRSRGVARVDDRRVLSGIAHVIRTGLRWRDAPPEYGRPKTLYNRFVRWTRAGVFAAIFGDLASETGEPEQLMIDATHLKAHRTAASLLVKKGGPRRIGRTKGGLNSKLHAVCDRRGRPLVLMLTEGQVNDHRGAAALFDALPPAVLLIGDRGYDSDSFRAALVARGTTPCIPPRRNRKVQHAYDRSVYRTRHKIENMFAKLKDWRRVATRYDRCGDIFMGTITFAATVIFWLPK